MLMRLMGLQRITIPEPHEVDSATSQGRFLLALRISWQSRCGVSVCDPCIVERVVNGGLNPRLHREKKNPCTV